MALNSSAGRKKQVLKAAPGSRQLQPDFLDLSEAIIVALDKRCKVTMINRKGCEVLGLAADEVIGREWVGNYIPDSDQLRVKSSLEHVLEDTRVDNPRYEESPVICLTGDPRIVRWHSTQLKSDAGEVQGLLLSGLDVTDLRQAERALRESEKRYRGLFDNAPVGIYRASLDGRILMANSVLVRMLKYSSFTELSAATQRNRRAHAVDQARRRFQDLMEKQGQIRGMESQWVASDGEILHVRENARAVRDEKTGGILFYEGTVEDITDKKKTQKDLDYRIRFERVIAGIATRFVNLSPVDMDNGINDALRQLGEFLGAERCHVFLDSKDRVSMARTHGWVDAEAGADVGGSNDISAANFKWLSDKVCAQQVVSVNRLDELPAAAVAEKALWASRCVKSLLIVPLISGAKTIGFMNFESTGREMSWGNDEVSFLKVAGEIIASALERKRAEDELRHRLAFEAMITQISAKFVNRMHGGVDRLIVQSLDMLGSFCGAERAFVCQFLETGLEATHSWNAPQAKPLPGVSAILEGVFPPPVCETLKAGGTVYFGDLAELVRHIPGKDAGQTLVLLRAFGIESVMAVPFTAGGNVSAFLGFTSPRKLWTWGDDAVPLLRIVGEIFAAALDRSASAGALEKERRLVTSLMDNVPDHIYFKDLQSRFIRINKSHANFFGLSSPAEAIGKSDRDFFSSEHADKAFEDEQRVIRTGEPMVDREEKETWEDGTVRWVSSTKMPLRNEKGEIVGTFGISRDSTERRRQEEEHYKIQARMQHAQKLESLGVLSGGIAHDFNNLLMGILGNTALALMDLGPESPAWTSIKQIETVALRAAELTNQMLAYSGKSKFIIKPLNLTALVKEMAHLLEVSISKKVQLVYDFTDHLPLVDGDAAQIRQVVMNLITNASDAMGEGRSGTITVKTKAVECDSAYLSGCYVGENLPAGRYISVDVSDTGCGMDAETQARIFDPFFTTKVTGRGLGLAAVLGIVRAHKGALRVYSELGKGTEFKVLFPCSGHQQEEAAAVRPEATAAPLSGQVLVIDDDTIVLMVTEQILKKTGLRVIKARDAQSGLSAYRDQVEKTSVIILDVTLPDGSVSDVLTGLRAFRSDVPIILMSGYSEQSVSELLPSGSYQGFLQKPFNTDLLISKLREIMVKK